MAEAARPHVICDAKHLLLDPSHVTRAFCPKHRPGYLCGSKTYHSYARGAFGLACSLPGLRLEDFPRDHLRDIMDSMVEITEDAFLVGTPGTGSQYRLRLVSRQLGKMGLCPKRRLEDKNLNFC